MNKFTVLLLACSLMLTACRNLPLQRRIETLAVADTVTVGLIKYPAVRPYLQAAKPVVCGLANSGSNVTADQFIAAVQADPNASALATGPGTLILNNVFVIYGALQDVAGSNSSAIQQYMGGLCDGLTLGLGAPPSTVTSKARVLSP